MSELDFLAPELLTPPGTLKAWQGPNATTFRECVASGFNDVAISAELVGRARSPLLCDATVLPYHGRDRRIRQYSTESESSYRKRLATGPGTTSSLAASIPSSHETWQRPRIGYGMPMQLTAHIRASGY
jgi:hypothetical protein